MGQRVVEVLGGGQKGRRAAGGWGIGEKKEGERELSLGVAGLRGERVAWVGGLGMGAVLAVGGEMEGELCFRKNLLFKLKKYLASLKWKSDFLVLGEMLSVNLVLVLTRHSTYPIPTSRPYPFLATLASLPPPLTSSTSYSASRLALLPLPLLHHSCSLPLPLSRQPCSLPSPSPSPPPLVQRRGCGVRNRGGGRGRRGSERWAVGWIGDVRGREERVDLVGGWEVGAGWQWEGRWRRS